jgi:hypothetical protein
LNLIAAVASNAMSAFGRGINMKSKLLIIIASMSLIACAAAGTGTGSARNSFQHDADLIRLEHLEYWAKLIEQYAEIKSHYPLQDQTTGNKDIVLVKIATRQQQKYLVKSGDKYSPQLDINSSGFFKENSVSELITEIESVIGNEISEKYDIQKVPTSRPVGYFYFVSNDGYVLWVTCITCGVTKISTLALRNTPTVNIASEGLVSKVSKALTSVDMLNHPIYKQWRSQTLTKESYVRALVAEHERDSKQ